MDIVNKALRILLVPFVYVGWTLAHFANFGGSMSVVATYGKWFLYVMPGIATLVAFLALITSIALIADPSTRTVGVILGPIALLGCIGFLRGAVLAYNGAQGSKLYQRHMNDPMRMNQMLIALGVALVVMAFFALRGILSGEAPIGR